MRTHTYGERDYAFGQAMLTRRAVMHLTQVDLARFLAISRGAVLAWEAGSSYPKAEHLKAFIALCVERQVFAPGREAEEIRALWHAAHQKVLLDESWLSRLLSEPSPPIKGSAPGPSEQASARAKPVTGSAPSRRVDWDDALDSTFTVATSLNGQYWAAGGRCGEVRVWREGGQRLHLLWRAHTDTMLALAFSPDGTRLASGGEDGSLYVWKASDGTLLQRLQGHRGVVYGVVWSPDGTRLASGGGSRGSGEVVLWDARSGAHCGERMYTIASAPGSVLALDWSPRGELLVSGDSDGRLCWWDVQSGECLMQRQGHQGAIQSLRISPDGHRLASCGDEGTIQVWDLESGERLRRLRRDRPYERLNITGVKGLTQAEIASLRGLGAIEEETLPL